MKGNISEKEIITHIRLLNLYKIDKDHKGFLNSLFHSDIKNWINVGKELINKYSETEQKKYIKDKMKWIKQTNKKQYLKAFAKKEK